MKTLQNNFTTPEQSKRLLELGVPEDSADLSMTENGKNVEVLDGILYSEFIKRVPQNYSRTRFLPCWSVGRLIEIFSKCYTGAKCYYSPRNLYKTEFWIERFERLSKIGFIDFSKLED